MSHYTVAERLERLPVTWYQRTLFIIIATAWFFDCVDVAMMTFVLSSIKSEFSLTAELAGALASASFFGMFLGAAMAGVLADRFGRCVVFRWSMIIWGLSSLACAFAPNPIMLVALRVFLGIGMSMELPVGQALICEYIPASVRGKYIALLEGFWPLGFIAAGLLATIVLPLGGWRACFIAESIPALFVLIVRRFVPESPRWLEDCGRVEQADEILSGIENKVKSILKVDSLPEPIKFSGGAAPARGHTSSGGESSRQAEGGATDTQGSQGSETSETSESKDASPGNERCWTPLTRVLHLWSRQYRKRTFMVWVLWFFSLLGYYALTTWLGALLEARGFSMARSNQYVILISLAGLPGFFSSAFLIEKWGRKPTTVFTLIGSALCAYLYGNAPDLPSLIAFGLMMQFFLFGMWSALYAYTPELYPTRARATGAGFASSIGRVGALIGPALVGFILSGGGQLGVFVMAASCFMIAAVNVLVFGEETKGRVLEECAH